MTHTNLPPISQFFGCSLVFIFAFAICFFGIWRYAWGRAKKWKNIASHFPSIEEQVPDGELFMGVTARLVNISLATRMGPSAWLRLEVGARALHLANEDSLFPLINRLPKISIPWDAITINSTELNSSPFFPESYSLNFKGFEEPDGTLALRCDRQGGRYWNEAILVQALSSRVPRCAGNS